MCDGREKNDADGYEGNALTMDMIRAGIRAFENWTYEEEEVAALVASIYYACEEARTRKARPE